VPKRSEGGVPPVIVLTSTEPFLRLRRLAELRALAGEDGFDLVEFSGQDVRAVELLDAAKALPFLGERKVVVVRNAERIPPGERESLSSRLGELDDRALVVFVVEPNDEQKTLPRTDPLMKAIAKVGAIEDAKADKAQVVNEMRARAGAMGVRLDATAANALLEVTSEHITAAMAELEKCALFVGEGGRITPHVVKEVATPSRDFQVFRMLDAVCSGNATSALQCLTDLLSSGAKPEEAAFRHVFPLLHRQLRLLYQARAARDLNLQDDQADEIAPARHSWAEIARRGGFQRDKFRSLAQRLSLDQVSELLDLLLKADAELKGQIPSINARETLDRMVVEMCHVASASVSRR
jgi:DNA polymerase-3 subunit delta